MKIYFRKVLIGTLVSITFVFLCVIYTVQNGYHSYTLEELIGTPTEQVSFTLHRITVNDSCWFEYPSITGIVDNELQSFINQKLVDAIQSPYLKDESISTYSGPIIDEVPVLDYIGYCRVNLINDRMISVTFCISKSWRGTMYRSSDPYTLNLNLETGEELNISSIYKVDDQFVNTIVDDGYSKGGSNDWGYIQDFREAELILIKAIVLDDLSHHVFFTKDSIGVISDISYYGVIGEFSVHYERVSDWRLQ